jgi:hypothetical protein
MATGASHAGRQETAAPTTPYAIELRGISKAFGPVQANKDITIRCAAARSTASSAKTARASPR